MSDVNEIAQGILDRGNEFRRLAMGGGVTDEEILAQEYFTLRAELAAAKATIESKDNDLGEERAQHNLVALRLAEAVGVINKIGEMADVLDDHGYKPKDGVAVRLSLPGEVLIEAKAFLDRMKRGDG